MIWTKRKSFGEATAIKRHQETRPKERSSDPHFESLSIKICTLYTVHSAIVQVFLAVPLSGGELPCGSMRLAGMRRRFQSMFLLETPGRVHVVT